MEQQLTTLSDEELIKRAILNDSSCLGALYTRYYQQVYQQCMGFVKDRQAAFDLSQDILIKAFLHLPAYRGEASFATWLWSIARNHCNQYLRREKQHQAFLPLQEDDPSISEWQDEDRRQEALMEKFSVLELLPEKDKELLMLKYGRNKSVQELQKMYNLRESAVKMRLKRAKDKLTRLFYQHHLLVDKPTPKDQKKKSLLD